jgi:hypothetical protein
MNLFPSRAMRVYREKAPDQLNQCEMRSLTINLSRQAQTSRLT